MATVIQFTVGDGTTGVTSNSFTAPILAGKKIKVFREGLYQYNTKGPNYIINTNSGPVFFFPAFYEGERIRIQTVD